MGNSQDREQRTKDTDHDIANQAEPGALHQEAGEPARDPPDHQGDDECCQHCFPPKLDFDRRV